MSLPIGLRSVPEKYIQVFVSSTPWSVRSSHRPVVTCLRSVPSAAYRYACGQPDRPLNHRNDPSFSHVGNVVSSELIQLGWEVLPSHANFILAICPDGRGRDAYIGLKNQGILVRYFDKPGLTDKIRITIGTSQENNALIGGIKALTAAEKAA